MASTLTMTLTVDSDGSLLDLASSYYYSKALFEGVILVAISTFFVTHNCSASGGSSQTIYQERLGKLPNHGSLLDEHVIIVSTKQPALFTGF